MKRGILFLIFLCFFCLSGCSDELKYNAEEITVAYEDYELPGILTVPKAKEKVPVIIFVHGGGLIDMNGTMGVLKPYEELSVAFAKQGIASIRYDKVTLRYQKEFTNNYEYTVYDEFVDSTIAAFELIKEDERIDINNVFVIGHSQGGQMAPIIVNYDNRIKGAILMGGTSAHILELRLEQLQDQNSSFYDSYVNTYNFIKNITEVNESNREGLYLSHSAAYWSNYNNINIEQEVIDCANNYPMLIMHGGKDLQVKPKHFDRYQELLNGKENVQLKFYENLNHAFVDGTDDTIHTEFRTYKEIPDEVINDIVNFVKNNLG